MAHRQREGEVGEESTEHSGHNPPPGYEGATTKCLERSGTKADAGSKMVKTFAASEGGGGR